MALANPSGSVAEAATAIEKLLGDEPKEEEEKVASEEATEEVSEETADEAPEEAPDEESDQDAEAEAEGISLEELPGTIEEFAEELGLTADELGDHLKISVKVNGETRAVNLNEARKGYQLEADYRTKTADHAEKVRSFDEAVDGALKEYQSRFQSLHQLTQQLEQAVVGNSEQDLLVLLENEGIEAYHHAKAQLDARKALLSDAKKQKEDADNVLAEQERTKRANYVREEQNALLLAMPELSDSKRATEFSGQVTDILTDLGFSAEEQSGLVDHRLYKGLKEIAAYRALKGSQPEIKNKLKSLPKVMKPGAKRGKGEVKAGRMGGLAQRLKKSGDVRDAAKFFEEIL